MSLCEAVPQGVLPTRDDAVVVTHGAVPENTVVFITGGVGHDDSTAATMSGPATTSHRGWIVDVGCGIHDDAREVLCEDPSTRRHVRHGACGCQVVSKINDPRIAHGAAYEQKR